MLTRWDPLREALSLRDRLDRLFDEAMTRPRNEWLPMLRDAPALDMYETDEAVKVEVQIPGFKTEEVEISTTGNTLAIKGKRSTEEEIKEEHYYRHETHYGSFTRTVTLPECADVEQAEATFENGILTITFLKVATVQPKRIDIKAKALEVEKGA